MACSAVPCSEFGLGTQAQVYYVTVSACMGVGNCTAMMGWDFEDKDSWIQPGANEWEGQGYLFFEDLSRHPRYTAVQVAQAIRGFILRFGKRDLYAIREGKKIRIHIQRSE